MLCACDAELPIAVDDLPERVGLLHLQDTAGIRPTMPLCGYCPILNRAQNGPRRAYVRQPPARIGQLLRSAC